MKAPMLAPSIVQSQSAVCDCGHGAGVDGSLVAKRF